MNLKEKVLVWADCTLRDRHANQVYCTYTYTHTHTAHKESLEPKDQVATGSETPEWEEEIIAENKDERVKGEGDVLAMGETSAQSKESSQLNEKVLTKEEKQKPGQQVVAGSPQGPSKDNEYILDGFDFSTGMFTLHTLGGYGRVLNNAHCNQA